MTSASAPERLCVFVKVPSKSFLIKNLIVYKHLLFLYRASPSLCRNSVFSSFDTNLTNKEEKQRRQKGSSSLLNGSTSSVRRARYSGRLHPAFRIVIAHY